MSKIILSELTNSKGVGEIKLPAGTSLDLTTSNTFLNLPKGTTTQRPNAPQSGSIRYNTDLKELEYYDGTQWQILPSKEDYEETNNGGVVWELDASNPESYPGAGNRWYSSIGTYIATKAGSQSPSFPQFNQEGEVGYFTFTGGVNGNNYSRFDIASPEMATMTAIAWHRPTGTYGHVFRMSNDDYQIGPDNYAAGDVFNDVQVTHSIYGNPVAPDKLNQWNFDAVTWDNQTVRSYHNGVYGGANTRSVAKNINAGSLRIGARSDVYAAHYVGDIAYVKLFNRQLSNAEIWKEYVALAPRFGINPIPSIPTNGLVLHLDAADYNSYPRSGTTWYDLSGNNNHVEMDASLVPTFERNSVFRVIGGSNFETTTANIPLTRLTMVGWYKSITRGTGGYPRLLELHKTGTTVSNSHALAVDSDGSLRAWVETGDSTAANRIASADDGTAYPLNEWIMFAYTFDGSTGRIYVNGVNTASAAGSSNLLDTVNIITIGAIPDFNTYQHNEYCLDAEISQIIMYNRALTTLEINELFNNLRTRYGI